MSSLRARRGSETVNVPTKVNPVFFAKEGEKGLNETSASHLCAVASNLKEEAEKSLLSISFVNVEMDIIGSSATPKLTQVGCTLEDLNNVDSKLNRIAYLNGFISWFAEARKQLENLRSSRKAMTMQAWAAEKEIELPKMPEHQDVYSVVRTSTLEDIIAEMSIKDRQTYLALEAKSAVFGKFIHPDGAMTTAREELHTRMNQPYRTSGAGRETIVYHYNPSIPGTTVDSEYLALQAEYRETEQALNHMKSDLRKKLDARNAEENGRRATLISEQEIEDREYYNKVRELDVKYRQFLQDEQTRISKIKFAIPAQYENLVAELNQLGK